MPDIHYPTSDGSRTTLLRRLDQKFQNTPPDDLPVPAALAAKLHKVRGEWEPAVRTFQVTASDQSGDVSKLTRAQATAALFVSHYFQVFNFAIRREVYQPADRALFGLPTNSSDLPDFRSEATLATWLANIAAGDEALRAAKRPPMTNPTAAEVAEKGELFNQLLEQRDGAGTTKADAAQAVDKLRPEVDELIADVYAELKHRYRKLAPPQWRDLARTYGFRYTNHRGEHPEGRYEDTLPAAETRDVYEGTFAANQRVRLRNTGLTPWHIALAADPDAPLPVGRGITLAPGQEVRCGLPELGNIGDRHLLIRNLSADQTGAYEIEFDAPA